MSQNEKTSQQSPLPKGWRWAKLEQICSIHPGQHILEAYYNREKVGIGYLTGPDDFGEMFPSITKWTENGKTWCQPGDILVTVKGAGVGKSNLAPEDKVAIGRQLMAVRPKTDTIDQFFLYNYIVLQLSDLRKKAMGSTVPGLARRDIENICIPLPPFLEQRRIAARIQELMEDVHRARAACEKQLEAAKALPAAYLCEVFESQEAKNWERKKLRHVCEIDGCPLLPDKAEARDLPYIGLEHIESGSGKIIGQIVDREGSIIKSISYKFDKRHVLYGKLRPYLNKVATPEFVGRCSTELVPFLPKEGCNREFLAMLLRRPQTVEEAMINKTGTRMPRADIAKMLELRIAFPSFNEQVRISAWLKKLIFEIEKAQDAFLRQLKNIEALPNSVLLNAFRGNL
jgi:type I restriction enzyme S subunit